MSYSTLPCKPHHNGSILLGSKAALQGPPSTLVLSSPHPQQVISQQAGTSPICCTPQLYPSFSHYEDAEFFSWVNISISLFHNSQTAFRKPFPDALIGNANHTIAKGVLGSYLYHHESSLKVALQQHLYVHANHLFFFFFKWATKEKGHGWSCSHVQHNAVGQAKLWLYETHVELHWSIPKEIQVCGTKLC